MCEPDEEIVVVPLWQALLPLVWFWLGVGLLTFAVGFMRSLS